jgi:hypothetical protein
MSVTRKFLRSLSIATLLLLMAGCSGITAKKDFSILDLLLPGAGGFIKADPPRVEPDLNHPNPSQKSVTQIA